MSARIPTIHEVHDSRFSLSGGLEVLTSIYRIIGKRTYLYSHLTSVTMFSAVKLEAQYIFSREFLVGQISNLGRHEIGHSSL
jgi:hypothetical protein